MPASIPIRHRDTLANRGCDPAAGDLLPQNDCPVVVEDQMQGILARIDADGGCD
jgi:hypothetical protein